MSLTVNVHEAKTHFSHPLDKAHAGKETVLPKACKPHARLLPLAPATPCAPVAARHLHRDPFDRMLAAQAELERATLVTRDEAFGEFACAVLW